LVVMQHHHVAVVGKLDPCKLPGREQHRLRIGASRHRQHEVEGLAPMADVVAAELPLSLDVEQGALAALDDAPVILDLEPAVSGDVTEVGSYCPHAPPSPGDLDHDLGRSANGGFDAAADHLGTARSRAQAGRVCLDDAVAGIEEAVAPLDEDGVEGWISAHDGLLEVEDLAHALPLRSDMSSAMTAAESSRCLRTSPSRVARRPRYSRAAATEPMRKRCVRLLMSRLRTASSLADALSAAKPATRSADGMTGGVPSIRRIR